MKIETYLNALCLSKSRSNDFDQFNKFFDRILKIDQEQRMDLAQARMELEVTKQAMSFYLNEKDTRINTLENLRSLYINLSLIHI